MTVTKWTEMKWGAMKRNKTCQNDSHWNPQIRKETWTKRQQKKLKELNATKNITRENSGTKWNQEKQMRWHEMQWNGPKLSQLILTEFTRFYFLSWKEGFDIRGQSATNTLERRYNKIKCNWMKKKISKWSDYDKMYWDEMRCCEKRSTGDESSILGEHTSAVLGVRQCNTRDTEKIQESPHDVLLSLLPSEWGSVTVIHWCYSFPIHPTNSPFQIWHGSWYKIHFFLN